jgi:hypothetical protein
MSAWDHLPNAKHIDRVLTSIKSHPDVWDHVWHQGQPRWATLNQLRAHEAARDSKREIARDEAWNVVRDLTGWAIRPSARFEKHYGARRAAREALLALIVYDDCASYLDLSVDQLQMLYELTEHPACVLLHSAVLVFAKEKELA